VRSIITPHASHRMGIVEGERCCLDCYAAPWMAISERLCGSEATGGDTEARDAAIEAAYNAGTPLRVISAQLGASGDTIHRVVNARCVRRRADRPKLPPITPDLVAEAQARQVAGEPMADIAASMGIDYKRLIRKLREARKAAA
jgi:hypothetical protein